MSAKHEKSVEARKGGKIGWEALAWAVAEAVASYIATEIWKDMTSDPAEVQDHTVRDMAASFREILLEIRLAELNDVITAVNVHIQDFRLTGSLDRLVEATKQIVIAESALRSFPLQGYASWIIAAGLYITILEERLKQNIDPNRDAIRNAIDSRFKPEVYSRFQAVWNWNINRFSAVTIAHNGPDGLWWTYSCEGLEMGYFRTQESAITQRETHIRHEWQRLDTYLTNPAVDCYVEWRNARFDFLDVDPVPYESMSDTELGNALEQMDERQLKFTLQKVNRSTLQHGLNEVDPNTLIAAVEVLDRATLKLGLQCLKKSPLKYAVEKLRPMSLKIALQIVDADTLENAIELMDYETLKVAVRVMDQQTYDAAYRNVDEATKKNMREILSWYLNPAERTEDELSNAIILGG